MLACRYRVCRAGGEFDEMEIFGQHAPGKVGDNVFRARYLGISITMGGRVRESIVEHYRLLPLLTLFCNSLLF